MLLFTGKMFILELLNKFIKKYVLSNILQENALRPLPRLGVTIDIDLPARIETLQVGIETATSSGILIYQQDHNLVWGYRPMSRLFWVC